MKVQTVQNWRIWMWCLWLVTAMLLLAVLDLTLYGLVVPASALLLAVISGPAAWRRQGIDRLDLAVVAALYIAVVALFRVAFTVCTVTNVFGLFPLSWCRAGPGRSGSCFLYRHPRPATVRPGTVARPLEAGGSHGLGSGVHSVRHYGPRVSSAGTGWLGSLACHVVDGGRV